MKLVFLIGRILFVAIFVSSGLTGHLLKHKLYAGFAAAAGVPLPEILAPLSGLLAVVGGLMLLLGIKPKAGAWILFIFLVPVTLYMHRFWGLSDPHLAQMQQAHFMKNVALIGATLMFQLIDRWPLSIRP